MQTSNCLFIIGLSDTATESHPSGSKRGRRGAGEGQERGRRGAEEGQKERKEGGRKDGRKDRQRAAKSAKKRLTAGQTMRRTKRRTETAEGTWSLEHTERHKGEKKEEPGMLRRRTGTNPHRARSRPQRGRKATGANCAKKGAATKPCRARDRLQRDRKRPATAARRSPERTSRKPPQQPRGTEFAPFGRDTRRVRDAP